MSSVDTNLPAENPLRASQAPQSAQDYVTGYLRRLRGGDLGSLPIIIGLILIGLFFQSQNDNFFVPRNLVNLVVQMTGITIIAYGVVYVLLLGEIDLSISYVSAVAAVLMVLLLNPPAQWPDWVPALPWFVAVALALGAALLIGLLQGTIITFFQLPSFVVTLAGFLAWNGVVLILIGGAGTVNIPRDSPILGLTRSFLPDLWGWIAAAAFVAFNAFTQIMEMRSRQAKGLSTRPLTIILAQTAGLALLVSVAVYICNLDRGVPIAGVVMVVLLIALSYVATRTRFGRYIYAVGGNKEAARRAGIATERIRVSVFMISSLMAGFGGIILAARLGSVATNAGGGDLLLNSIAAAVIGGTSLFGGSGRVSSAVLGALVIATVDNGMGLLGLSAGVKFIVTGLVLLAAVILDSFSRRRQQRTGLR
ncbi:MAG: ABC transporter permease [bacterium]|nr:ABC transporter permease [bacterium]